MIYSEGGGGAIARLQLYPWILFACHIHILSKIQIKNRVTYTLALLLVLLILIPS